MPSLPPDRPLRPAYDFIIVGGGSAGCVLARRLIEGSDATVLLVEAGHGGFDLPEIVDPAAWVPLGRSRHDWGYDYTPTDRVNGRRIGIPRGRLLGGSSAINAMMWYRGHPSDYDAWAAAGCDGWSFADCLPWFKRAEDWEGGETPWRGAGGPLRIERSRNLHPTAAAMLDGAAALGIPVIDDPNGPDNEGAAPANFNIAAGRRWSSAQGYLAPVLDNPRLTVLTGRLALALIVEGTRCTGLRHAGADGATTTAADSAVLLAAGAIDTPRLLMLSGIGDPAELARLGLPAVHGLPGVGRNLQDHPLVQACVFRAKRPLGPVLDQGGGTMLNWKSRADRTKPDLHAFPVQGNSAEAAIRARFDTSGDVFSIGAGLMDSRSVGHLRLIDPVPGGRLDIQPNFLAEPSDLDALVEAVATVLDLVTTPAYADWFAGFTAPDRPLDRRLDRKAIVDFIRDGCSTFFHTCGTCAMGTGAEAVVDPRLRVHGIDGLMIADASVIPTIPTCNTHAPVTMIAERAAAFLLHTA